MEYREGKTVTDTVVQREREGGSGGLLVLLDYELPSKTLE